MHEENPVAPPSRGEGAETPQDRENGDPMATLLGAGDAGEFFNAWLALATAYLPELIQAMVFVSSGSDAVTPAAIWPPQGRGAERIIEVTEKSLEDQCGVVVRLPDRPDSSHPCYGVAMPVSLEDRVVCTITVELGAPSQERLESMVHSLQFFSAWAELFFSRDLNRQRIQKSQRMQSALDLMAGVQSRRDWKEAALGFCADLAVLTDCDRVSVGFVKGKTVGVEAMSNTSELARKMNLVRAIEEAMAEAVIMRAPVFFPMEPDPAGPQITTMHARLSSETENGAVLSLPFFHNSAYQCVLTLERKSSAPFTQEECRLCKGIISLVFPALLEKRENHRHILLKLVDAARDGMAALVGKNHLGKKCLALVITIALVAAFTLKGEDRISSRAVMECSVKQVVSIPFDGYIRSSKVRPGDHVATGQELCRMDDRDLALEKMNHQIQKAQYEKQFRNESARHNRAEARVIKTRIQQAQARIDQVDSRLERTRLTSPFEGILVNGDLTRRLGSFVQQGEPVFEIAPLDGFRLAIKVDEKQIRRVETGQTGTLALFSMPGQTFDFMVERITPISQAEEGSTYFRVEAVLDTVKGDFRPGMEGIAKIFIQRETYGVMYTRSLVNWGRLFVWKYFL